MKKTPKAKDPGMTKASGYPRGSAQAQQAGAKSSTSKSGKRAKGGK
jgi:hypothetical protein